jgi:hypothetical protein
MARLEEGKFVQASSPIPVVEDDALSELSEPPPIPVGKVEEDKEEEERPVRDEYELPPMKRARGQLSLEEYEAMLDAEDEPGGFLEGGDIIV